MPRLTRWYLRTALVYLALALLAGAALAARLVADLPAWSLALQPVYIHLLTMGWITQVIFGMVFWMFPKQSAERPRGSEALGWAAYAALNLGLGLRALGEPLLAWQPDSGFGWLLAVSAVLQFLAGMAFIFNSWGRVKER